jgi:light-regulated signal transduction histidine kinase (bacteriophytochrome)
MNTLCHETLSEQKREIAGLESSVMAMRESSPANRMPGPDSRPEADELEEALQISSSLLSHDLGAPARAIQAFAEALLEDCGDHLASANEDYLRRIIAASTRLNGLIRDLTVYKRLHQREVDAKTVYLDYVIMEAMAKASPNIPLDVVRPVPGIRSDERLLFEALRNLCSLAVRFAVPRPDRIRAVCEERGGWVRILLELSGAEIDRRICDKLKGAFRPECPAEEVISLGLELAIVRRSARRLQARLGADMSDSREPRFWIDLPQF